MSHKLNIELISALFDRVIYPFVFTYEFGKMQNPHVRAKLKFVLYGLCDNNRSFAFSVCMTSVVHTFCFQRPNEKANRQKARTNPAARRKRLRKKRSSAVRRNALRGRRRKSIRRNVRLFKLRRIRPGGRFRLHVFQNLKFTKKANPMVCFLVFV